MPAMRDFMANTSLLDSATEDRERVPSSTRRFSIHPRPPRRFLRGFGSKGAKDGVPYTPNNSPSKSIRPSSPDLPKHFLGHRSPLVRRLPAVPSLRTPDARKAANTPSR